MSYERILLNLFGNYLIYYIELFMAAVLLYSILLTCLTLKTIILVGN